MVDPPSDRVPRAPPYSFSRFEDFGFCIRGCHALRRTFPDASAILVFLTLPGGLLPFRSPLLRESRLISFPGLLRWFTSPSFASVPYFIQVFRCWNRSQRVTPFGYLRLIEYVLLPAAFRSLSRPSSPYSSIGIRHRPIFRLTILFFLFRICTLSAALMPSSSALLPLACNATPSPY